MVIKNGNSFQYDEHSDVRTRSESSFYKLPDEMWNENLHLKADLQHLSESEIWAFSNDF